MVNLISNGRYTRLPVYENNLDNVLGILNVKDLFSFMGEQKQSSFDLKNLIRKPYFVVTLQRTDDVFREMQKHKIHMAVVLDDMVALPAL